MDPFVEQDPIFHELHVQLLAKAQAQLQAQIRPNYVARLEGFRLQGQGLFSRKLRRIVISSLTKPSITVAVIELLTPSTKEARFQENDMWKSNHLPCSAASIV
jgi:hypothetical protein